MFNIKKIIIVVVIVVLAFIGYSFLISGKKQDSASGVTKQSVSTNTAPQSNSTTLDGPGKEFVTQLLAIQNIKFNLQLFADPVFQGLQDWSREILPQETGRPNPFAPLDGETGLQTSNGTMFSGDIRSISPAGMDLSSSTSIDLINSPIKTIPSPKGTSSRTTNTKTR